MARVTHDQHAATSLVAASLARLGPDWTVLASPRFGLERPAAVALHERHGVCVVVATGIRAGEAERSADGHLVEPAGHERRLDHQPHLDAERIGLHVYDAYYAALDDPTDPAGTVRWLLVAPFVDDATARALLAPRGATDADTAVAVWGRGFDDHVESALIGSGADATVGSANSPATRPIDRSGLERVRRAAILGPIPDIAAMRPAPIREASASIVAAPTGARLRRVRGRGGTGKTWALTTRAAELASDDRTVLVLSFTTTLAARLGSLVVDRCTERGADARLVTVTNFHALCEHAVVTAEAAGHRSVWPEGTRWPVAIVDRARQVIEQGFDHRYDAILVDEGQDFSFDWWEMLQANFLADGGEMLVTNDPTQNLYRVDPWFDDEQMTAIGFTDPWIELEGTVRTPPDLLDALTVVGDEEQQPVAATDLERTELVGPPVASVRRWVDIDRVADLGREIGREVVRLVRDHPTLTPGDIVFLCDYHHDGLAAVREIERAGIPVHHQFSRDPAGRGVRRRRFSVDAAAVKGATVHGFKGWEAGAVVMGIGADATSTALAAIAIERVSTPASGGSALVTIVNGDRGRRSASAGLGWDDDTNPTIEPPASLRPAGVTTATPVDTCTAASAPTPPVPPTPAEPPTPELESVATAPATWARPLPPPTLPR
ncbi:MAG: hypothetical protein AAFP84_12805 [Actinomycetota bacterium]